MRIASIRMVLVILNLISLMPACLAADWGTLQPVMVIPEKSVLQETFSKSGPVNKTNWQSRQGTRWSIEQGVLRGRPSSKEYQINPEQEDLQDLLLHKQCH